MTTGTRGQFLSQLFGMQICLVFIELIRLNKGFPEIITLQALSYITGPSFSVLLKVKCSISECILFKQMYRLN